MGVTAREIRLAARPSGWPTDENFAFADVEVPSPGAGELLVRNTFMSVDPYMRGRMNDVKSYTPPFELGKALEGGAVGEVVESGVDGVATGDLVLHNAGWRSHALVSQYTPLTPIEGVSPSRFLGALGMPALTAYVGLLDIARFTPGEAVFVSGAAGAVGSVAGQIARLKGASRVIGSAGSAEKVAHLTDDLGFDAAFNYRDGDVGELLAQAAPDGIDVYFDNVGGDHLQAAIDALRTNGRVAVCGSISMYNEKQPPPGPRNLHLLVGKRLTLRGFIILDHYDRFGAMAEEVGQWLANGELVAEETVVDGLDNAPAAFVGMLRGENTGKMVVRL
ncbi:NADP-dependent oxidoreductase [Actinophytocola sp. NPDC049390]|uniref:NADP-dependent oxidoreductase n=1 Tax=Actinophytocola sp. NPDC049390 TaxID=3363894 RepID=UPI0037BDE706